MSAPDQAAAAAAAARQAELAREAEARRQAELARQRAAAAERQREEQAARQREQQQKQQQQQHQQQEKQEHERTTGAHAAVNPHNVGAVLGGFSAAAKEALSWGADNHAAHATAAKATKPGAPPPAKPPPVVDKGADSDFKKLETKDHGDKDKLAGDAYKLLQSHPSDPLDQKYREQVVADATRSGVLAKTIDPSVNSLSGIQGQAISATTSAVRDGLISGKDVLNAAKGDKKNSIAQQTADYVTRNAVRNVDIAKSGLEDAQGEKKKLDTKLAGELAQVGPGLTDAQKKQFISSFQKEHKYHELDHKIDTAATNLETTLKHNQPTLNESVKEGGANVEADGSNVGPKIGNKDVADASLGALKDLATTKQAGDALKMSSAMMKDPALQTAMNNADHNGLKDTMNTVIEEALPRVGMQMLAGQKKGKEGDKEQASMLSQLHETLEPFDRATQVFGAGQKLTQALPALKDALKGNFTSLTKLTGEWAKENPSAIEKGFATLALASGASEFPKAEGLKELMKTVGSTGEGLQTIAKSAGTLEWVSKLGGDASKVTGRFAPGLGVLWNLASAGADWKQGGPGAVPAVAGDLISAIGSGLESTPLAPVGALVDAAGTIVSGVGYGINAIFGHGEQSPNDEAAKLLQKDLHFGKNNANGLAHANLDELKILQKRGLAPGQIDNLAGYTKSAGADINVERQMIELGMTPQQIGGLANDKDFKSVLGRDQGRDALTVADKYNVPGADFSSMVHQLGYQFSREAKDPLNRGIYPGLKSGEGAGWQNFENTMADSFGNAMTGAHAHGENNQDPKVLAKYLDLHYDPGFYWGRT